MYPKPFVAPNISATTIAIKPFPTEIFKPLSVSSNPSGILMFQKTCHFVAPQFCAASITSLSVEFSPLSVDEMIGYAEFQMITNILGASPIPISTMKSGNKAIDGIFFVEFIIGIIRHEAFSLIEQIMAIATPAAKDIPTPKITIFTVYARFI